MKTFVILMASLSICCKMYALPTDGNCRRDYQAVLKQVDSLEEKCGGAEMHDCCTGVTLFKAFRGYSPSIVYEVHSACGQSLNPFHSTKFARCDMKSDNGGWLVVFRRDANVTTSVDFDRTWVDYETGFGDLETEFWYGLKEMHCLTQEDVDMRLDLTFTNGTSIVWTYGLFKVDGPETNYKLHIGQAVGSPGTHSPDAITRHIRPEPGGTPFTTKDRDNDGNSGGNCATSYHGGWWWNACGHAKLTRPHSSGMLWYSYIISFVEMKIRPKSCQESCS